MTALRVAVITDIHNGPDQGAKLGTKAPKLMEAFVKAAKIAAPDMVVDLGDRVTSSSPADAREKMQAVKNYFNRLAAPVHHVVGNHDIKHLTRAENEAITGSPSASYSLDMGDYHFVFWNPGDDKALDVLPADLDWLRDDLAAADKPTVVFSHVPLDLEQEDFAGRDQSDIAGRFHYAQGQAIHDVLEQSGKVVLCMAGHRHHNRYSNVNGIHYIQQQSLINVWKKDYRVPSRAWALLDFDRDTITVNLRGRAPMRLNGQMVKKYQLQMKPMTPPAPLNPPSPDASGPAPL